MINFLSGLYLGGMLTYFMLAVDSGDFSIMFFFEASIWPISLIETIIKKIKGK